MRSNAELRFDDGEVIRGWTSLAFREAYAQPQQSLTFTVEPSLARLSEYRERLSKGSGFTFHAAGNQQCLMVVTGTTLALSARGTSMTVQGAGVLHTVMGSSADHRLHKRSVSDRPLQDVIGELFEPYGFDLTYGTVATNIATVSGKALEGGVPPPKISDLKIKDLKVQPGEGVYQTAARLCARLGFVLSVDAFGYLLISRPDYAQPPRYTVALEGGIRGADRMLLDEGIEERDTNEGQYSEVIVEGKTAGKRGQKSVATPFGGLIVAGAPRGPGFAGVKPTEAPRGRHHYRGKGRHAAKPFYKVDKKCRDISWCSYMANTAMHVQAINGYQLRHSVTGIISRSSSSVWALNTVGRVVVDQWFIDEKMWLYERAFKIDNKGEMATLTWVPLGALLIGDMK